MHDSPKSGEIARTAPPDAHDALLPKRLSGLSSRGPAMATAAFSHAASHFGAQILHRAGVALMATAACSHAASHFGAQILHRAGVALMATAACSHAASHLGAQILHAQVSPGWRRRRVATLLRSSVLKSCIVQVSPRWRRQRLATLLRTSVLKSCIVQVSPRWRRRRVATLLRTSVLKSSPPVEVCLRSP
jgi:hypothetical protein